MVAALAIALHFSSFTQVPTGQALLTPNPRVLVFSKTAGFRHDSIPVAIEAIKEIATKRGFTVTATEDASVFSTTNLEKFDAVLFLCTTGDILDGLQQDALYKFVTKDGGGFLGLHAAADTEYDWPQYKDLIGAYFKRHPQIQEAKIIVEDPCHPSTQSLPKTWTRTDEWYDYIANPRKDVRVLMSLDPKSYTGSEMPDDHPITWCNEVGNGRTWYSGLGHTKETYAEPLFMDSLYEAIVWTSQKSRPKGRTDLKWKTQKGWTEGGNKLDNVTGQADHLVSTESFGDALIHVEFAIPKGSNSGVYVQGRYEVQIFDSFGKTKEELTFADSGGIYQRWKDEKGFEGMPPKVNALRPPGQWNTYDILFRAPRFEGKRKVANARFLEVRLNGIVIQKDVEVTGPTRASMREDEVAAGPIMLQGDHGPIMYRNVWAKPWPG